MIRLLAVGFIFLLSGCGSHLSYMEAKTSPFIQANYQATDAMIASMSKEHALPADAKVLVATVVELDTLNESSTLGRSISEQVQARLTQRGYAVVEAKLRGQMVMNKAQGELMLSRELRDLQKSHSAEAVVVGTYTLARNYVYVNLKMIGPDNIALGAHNYALPLDRNVRALLNKQP